jgi:hypothetical protein
VNTRVFNIDPNHKLVKAKNELTGKESE